MEDEITAIFFVVACKWPKTLALVILIINKLKFFFLNLFKLFFYFLLGKKIRTFLYRENYDLDNCM